MKNTKIIAIAVGIIAIVGIGLGVYSYMNQENQSQTQNIEEIVESDAKPISSEDVGLELSLTPDKKAIIMKITKLEGIESVEYMAQYDAEVTESGETLTVTRGVGPSTIEVEPGDMLIERDDITLGTCSRNVCKYDTVVSDITFALRVNYTNDEVGSLEETITY